MLSKTMEKGLNEQMVAETYSAYLYWSMAAHLHDQDYPGMAHWMECQAKEELSHAVKIYGYMMERGSKARMSAIDEPPSEWDSPLHVMDSVLDHERKVTAMINALMDKAIDEKDHASNQFLAWFVTEQVEEESTASAILSRMKKMGDYVQGLIMLDDELGSRKPLYDLLPKSE